MSYYTVYEVAELFRLRPQVVYRLIYEGKIKAIKVGGAVRISSEEIDRIKAGK